MRGALEAGVDGIMTDHRTCSRACSAAPETV